MNESNELEANKEGVPCRVVAPPSPCVQQKSSGEAVGPSRDPLVGELLELSLDDTQDHSELSELDSYLVDSRLNVVKRELLPLNCKLSDQTMRRFKQRWIRRHMSATKTWPQQRKARLRKKKRARDLKYWQSPKGRENFEIYKLTVDYKYKRLKANATKKNKFIESKDIVVSYISNIINKYDIDISTISIKLKDTNKEYTIDNLVVYSTITNTIYN